jgi:hemin uptake protein HemP
MNQPGDKEEATNKGEEVPMTQGLRRQITVIDNRMDSREIFLGTRDVVILHGRDIYRLRLTAQNKLILTK